MNGASIRPQFPWLILLLLASPLHAEDFTGKVVGITDGDTIKVLVDRRPLKIRLYGIGSGVWKKGEAARPHS
jgi:endonuclease YncB( thermonuclease family)